MADENTVNQTGEKPVFMWKAPEFASYQKNGYWFAIISVVAIALIVVFAVIKNWTAAGLVLAAALALFSMSRANPRKISCSLFHNGIVIEQTAYRFSDLKSFWMISGEHPSVRFSKTGRFTAPINMPIAEEDPEQVRLFLSKYLPQEAEKGEDIADAISRWMKF